MASGGLIKTLKDFIYGCYLWLNSISTCQISAFSVKLSHRIKNNYVCGSNVSHVELTEEELKNGCKLGLDSHADVSCIGRHGRILETLEGQYCTVYPFNESYAPMQKVETVNAAFAVDTETGPTYILRVNQALNFTSTMTKSLLCTNQSRANGIIIDDIPPTFDRLGNSTCSIYDLDKQIRLPLQNKGPTPHLDVRYPTDDDLERYEQI